MANCLIWLSGYTDSFIHQDIIDTHIPSLSNYDIHPVLAMDYDLKSRYPYSTSDFKLYIPVFERKIKRILSLYKNKKKVLYAHSTGYLIACFLLKYTTLSKHIHKLILNDPFVDINESYYIKYFASNIHLHPLTWKLNWYWRMNFLAVINNKTDSTYRIKQKEITHLSEKTRSLIKCHNYPVQYAGFPTGATKAQKEIANHNRTEPYLNNFPVLILIANGVNQDGILSKKDTVKAKYISVNSTVGYVDDVDHDIFFPLQEKTYSEINRKIGDFLNEKVKPTSKITILRLNPSNLHNNLLVIPNLLSIIAAFLIYKIFI